MKNLASIIFLLSYITTSSISQDQGDMHLVDHKLIGHCDNKYFTGFTIELDTIYSEIDSIRLFDQLPRIGKINFKNSREIPTEFTLTNRAGYAQIMFRFKSEWHTFDQHPCKKQ